MSQKLRGYRGLSREWSAPLGTVEMIVDKEVTDIFHSLIRMIRLDT